MTYEVRVVEDHQLPPSSDWTIVTVGGDSYLFLKRSKFQDPAVLARILTASWVAWQACPPQPRMPVAV